MRKKDTMNFLNADHRFSLTCKALADRAAQAGLVRVKYSVQL